MTPISLQVDEAVRSISKTLQELEQKTGRRVYSISLQYLNVTTIGDPKRRELIVPHIELIPEQLLRVWSEEP